MLFELPQFRPIRRRFRSSISKIADVHADCAAQTARGASVNTATQPVGAPPQTSAASNGVVVPLETLATVSETIGPQTISHAGQLAAVTLSFALAKGASLGTVLTRVQQVADDTIPDGVSGQFQGEAKAFQSSLGNLAVLLVVAIMVVYIVLGILYESYIHPLTILSNLPSAGFGALVTLILWGWTSTSTRSSASIMLIGIVVKNAIMQIDFALERSVAACRRGRSIGWQFVSVDHDDDDGGDAGPAPLRQKVAVKPGNRSAW